MNPGENCFCMKGLDVDLDYAWGTPVCRAAPLQPPKPMAAAGLLCEIQCLPGDFLKLSCCD